jgi:hypothetical protein
MIYDFTEQGVAMHSGVLRSKRAVFVNIAIMRVFMKICQILTANKDLNANLEELERRVGSHDVKIQAIFETIKQLTMPMEGENRGLDFIRIEYNFPLCERKLGLKIHFLTLTDSCQELDFNKIPNVYARPQGLYHFHTRRAYSQPRSAIASFFFAMPALYAAVSKRRCWPGLSLKPSVLACWL